MSTEREEINNTSSYSVRFRIRSFLRVTPERWSTFAVVREFLEFNRDSTTPLSARPTETTRCGVYELRNITVIHCISERPVTTFIQGRQVYTRKRSAHVHWAPEDFGRNLLLHYLESIDFSGRPDSGKMTPLISLFAGWRLELFSRARTSVLLRF